MRNSKNLTYMEVKALIGEPVTIDRLLSGFEKEFVIIPEKIISESKDDFRRIAAYAYFSIWSGRNRKALFNIEHLVSWCGYTPNNRAGKTNAQFKDIILWLCDTGCISCRGLSSDGEISGSRYTYSTMLEATLNQSWYKEQADTNRFAIIYLDEIDKIMEYKHTKRNTSLTNSNILYLFSYLRFNIPIRNSTEGENEERLLKSPECFYRYYRDISSDTGITEKTISSILRILSDLKLIYVRHIKRKKSKNKDGTDKYVTMPTLFCNRYKRLQGKLMYSGEDYYKFETENRIKSMNFDKIETVSTKVEDGETDYDITWIDNLPD